MHIEYPVGSSPVSRVFRLFIQDFMPTMIQLDGIIAATLATDDAATEYEPEPDLD